MRKKQRSAENKSKEAINFVRNHLTSAVYFFVFPCENYLIFKRYSYGAVRFKRNSAPSLNYNRKIEAKMEKSNRFGAFTVVARRNGKIVQLVGTISAIISYTSARNFNRRRTEHMCETTLLPIQTGVQH